MRIANRVLALALALPLMAVGAESRSAGPAGQSPVPAAWQQVLAERLPAYAATP